MKPGDIVLIPLPQMGGGQPKLRPVLILSLLPGTYQNVLICGVSTKTQHLEAEWDELLDPTQPDFSVSDLHRASSIRLNSLYSADAPEIDGAIGRISPERLHRLVNRLAARLRV